jgi:hypothetical protein
MADQRVLVILTFRVPPLNLRLQAPTGLRVPTPPRRVGGCSTPKGVCEARRGSALMYKGKLTADRRNSAIRTCGVCESSLRCWPSAIGLYEVDTARLSANSARRKPAAERRKWADSARTLIAWGRTGVRAIAVVFCRPFAASARGSPSHSSPRIPQRLGRSGSACSWLTRAEITCSDKRCVGGR